MGKQNYFKHAFENFIANDTVFFVSNVASESQEVAAPLNARLKAQLANCSEAKLPSKDEISSDQVDNIIELFEKNGPAKFVVVVAHTGQAERIVAALGQKTKTRPVKLLVMNSRQRPGYDVPENNLLDASFPTNSSRFKQCT